MNCIRWQLFLRVKSKEKASNVLRELSKALGPDPRVQQCDSYSKDPSLFRTTLTTSIAAVEARDAMIEVLQLAWALAGRWTVSTPQFYESGEWEWAGYADGDSFKHAVIAAADFEVGNVRVRDSEVQTARATIIS
jgi:hypothetical protein